MNANLFTFLHTLTFSESWAVLCQVALLTILGLLPARSLASAACVCRSWNAAARALNATPRLMTALSTLSDLQSAMDAVLEKVMAAPFRPDFAIIFAGQKFKLSHISNLLKEKLAKNLPVIACHAAGIIGQDAATGEHREMIWPQPAPGLSKNMSRRMAARQNGLVLVVGRMPGVHVQALSLGNSRAVEEVESFVIQAGSLPTGAYVPHNVKQLLLLGDPSADMIRLMKRLDKAFSGRSITVGGFAAHAHAEGGSLLAHWTPLASSPVEQLVKSEEKCSGWKMPDRTASERGCKRKAPEDPPVPAATSDSSNTQTCTSSASSRMVTTRGRKCEGTLRQDVVGLVFTALETPTNSTTKRVDCQVGAGGGLAAVGPLYTVVSVRQTKDPVLQETTTWLTCMKEGDDKELDGNSMIEDLDNQMNSSMPAYVGIWRPPRRNSRRIRSKDSVGSFSLHEVQGADEEYLLIGGEGVRTGDTLRFYASHPDAARVASQRMLAEMKASLEETSPMVGEVRSKGKQSDQAGPSNSSILARTHQRQQAFGGLLFACAGRGEPYFKESNVDSNTFLATFPSTPLAGMFCLGEVGPPSVLPCEDGGVDIHRHAVAKRERKTILNVFSSMFVVFSHDS